MQTSIAGGVRFYRVIPDAPAPTRADRAADGTLPTRASRYCDAVTTASGYGWWIYPPMAFSLLWTGEQIYWTWPAHDDWLELDAAQFPDLRARFDAAAPAALRGATPPFLTALPEAGVVQVWTGLYARTAPDWSLLLRAPANLAAPGGYVPYEGVVEYDRWFGPVFTNIRLTRTGAPVRLHADRPLLQAQPLPRIAYDEATLDAMQLVPDPESFAPADWWDYAASTLPPARRQGQYAIAARRRRKCPHTPAA
jgi:hypothetical protein